MLSRPVEVSDRVYTYNSFKDSNLILECRCHPRSSDYKIAMFPNGVNYDYLGPKNFVIANNLAHKIGEYTDYKAGDTVIFQKDSSIFKGEIVPHTSETKKISHNRLCIKWEPYRWGICRVEYELRYPKNLLYITAAENIADMLRS